jgi:ubiquinone/menaquinone biosynthesis C-methylase UbiE
MIKDIMIKAMTKFTARLYSRLLELTKVSKADFHRIYAGEMRRLKMLHPYDTAMKLAVGGQFDAIGILERETLIYFGLKKNDYLIDVGCGSGRLALPLSDYLSGRYLGIDIIREMLEYARKKVCRPDWRFEVAEGLTIPEQDGSADMVCFFSVFTHLLHEQSYLYLQDAKRVLKSGGKIVFSFLDLSVRQHWSVFEGNIQQVNKFSQLNMFMSKDAIVALAEHLDLTVLHIIDGDKPFVPLQKPVTFDNGDVIEGLGTIGQSVCVLSRK